MNSQQATMERSTNPHRIVEFEWRRPHREDLRLAERIEPVRRVAEDVLLTSLGVAVLAGRTAARFLQAAHQAGEEAVQNPGPLTRTLLRLVRTPQKASSQELSRRIPVLPIANYNALAPEEIIAHLDELSPEQLQMVRDYEKKHQQREAILAAIAERLAE